MNRIFTSMPPMGRQPQRDFFDVRSDGQNTYWKLVHTSCGIGFTQQFVAGEDSSIVRLLPEISFEPLRIWLAAPKAMCNTPPVKRVWNLLEEGITVRFPIA